MRILLTGASGFVGSAAARHLKSYGHHIITLIHRCPVPSPVTQMIQATLGVEDTVETIIQDCEPCEAIVHIAACINYDTFCPDISRVNCIGMQQILAVAHTWGVQTFIYISSIGVLGQPIEHPITEQHPTTPQTAYHASKLFGEHLLASTSTPGVSLRVTSPVGPGIPMGRIMSIFVQQALENRSLQLKGRGKRRQNYVDVRDIARAITCCLKYHPIGVFNIGGSAVVSNLELAEVCIRQLKSKSTIEFTGTPDPADDEVWDVCSQRAKDVFHYKANHNLESSIKAVAETCK